MADVGRGRGPSPQRTATPGRPLDGLQRNGRRAQFTRFVLVGGGASVVYAVLFLLVAGLGTQPANVVAAVVSSSVANELHRRLTFRVGQRVGWLRAQWQGGGLALAGLVATSAALGWFEAKVPGSSAGAHLTVVAVVTGAIGLIRFSGLRWLFGAREPVAA